MANSSGSADGQERPAMSCVLRNEERDRGVDAGGAKAQGRAGTSVGLKIRWMMDMTVAMGRPERELCWLS